MITKEKAKTLKIGDTIHCCLTEGRKCEEWVVLNEYQEDSEGWIVELKLRVSYYLTTAAICKARMGEWHLPGECPPPSTKLTVSIRREWDWKEVGHFYVNMNDSVEYLERNIPSLIRGAQIMSAEGFGR